jgi:hypothetical protein
LPFLLSSPCIFFLLFFLLSHLLFPIFSFTCLLVFAYVFPFFGYIWSWTFSRYLLTFFYFRPPMWYLLLLASLLFWIPVPFLERYVHLLSCPFGMFYLLFFSILLGDCMDGRQWNACPIPQHLLHIISSHFFFLSPMTLIGSPLLRHRESRSDLPLSFYPAPWLLSVCDLSVVLLICSVLSACILLLTPFLL